MKGSKIARKDVLLRDQSVTKHAIFHAARFLRAPVSNTLQYHLARLVRATPFLPRSINDKIDRSVRKRDFEMLAKVLETNPASMETPSNRELHNAFRKSLPSKRREALLSDEHIRLHAAPRSASRFSNLTISVVTNNSSHFLDRFFASLRTQCYPLENLTLRIADHGSRDDTVARAEQFIATYRAEFRDTDLICLENDGLVAGHDANIAASDDEFILVSNVALEFAPNTLTGLMSAAHADAEDVACWEPRLCPFEHSKFYDPVTLETAWCEHVCILLRRSAYRSVGGYERRLLMYGKDVELSYRFRGAGWRLRYFPHVAVRYFVDPVLRPHQTTGSIPANVLLRYRYGGDDVGVEGERLVALAAANEDDPVRKAELIGALDRIEKDRDYFRETALPVRKDIFPFDGLHYEIARRGHDTALNSIVDLQELPKVSIITRTHGPNQDMLREAIVSVLNQTYPNIEHIIVEDRGNQSEALTSQVAQRYSANIRFLRSDRGGRSAAGNDGLAAATGTLFLFLDYDDLLFADHVEILVRNLQASPNCVAVYSLAWELETFFNAGGAYREGEFSMPKAHAQPYDARRFETRNFLPIQSVLFRRHLYDAEGGIDEAIDHLEDWNLWSRYARMGPFKMVPKTTSIYRVPGDPVFREDRKQVMLAAEDAVRRKTFGYADRRDVC